jgi:hydroxymethylglutaryl-CoA lyase
MVRTLVSAGLNVIEATSFVRPEIVPQMRDAEKVMALLREEPIDATLRALIPNARGAERAAAAGVDEMVALMTVSEKYSMKNQNMTREENFRAFDGLAAVCRREGIPLLAALATAIFCPYEGAVPRERALSMVERLYAAGITRFTVASSVGVDGPGQVYGLCAAILDRWPDVELGYHTHNTNGLASANIIAAMQGGVTAIESCIGGLGGGIRMPRGMPYFGNFPTEDLVQMLDDMDIDCGLKSADVLAAAARVQAMLGLDELSSFSSRGGTRENVSKLAKDAPGYANSPPA